MDQPAVGSSSHKETTNAESLCSREPVRDQPRAGSVTLVGSKASSAPGLPGQGAWARWQIQMLRP